MASYTTYIAFFKIPTMRCLNHHGIRFSQYAYEGALLHKCYLYKQLLAVKKKNYNQNIIKSYNKSIYREQLFHIWSGLRPIDSRLVHMETAHQ